MTSAATPHSHGCTLTLGGDLDVALRGDLDVALRGALRGDLDVALRALSEATSEPALRGDLDVALRGDLSALRGDLDVALRASSFTSSMLRNLMADAVPAVSPINAPKFRNCRKRSSPELAAATAPASEMSCPKSARCRSWRCSCMLEPKRLYVRTRNDVGQPKTGQPKTAQPNTAQTKTAQPKNTPPGG